MELKLLYSYEEYKQQKEGHGISRTMQAIKESTARLMLLTLKGNPFNDERTEEEKAEHEKLLVETESNTINEKFTRLTHEITDLFYDLKDTHDNEQREYKYISMGRKQCEIEMMKEKYQTEK